MTDRLDSFVAAISPPAAPAEGGLAYAVRPLPGAGHYRVGKNSDGLPAFLVRSTPRDRPIPFRLQHLAIRPDVTCTVIDASGVTVRESLAIITCESNDPELQSYFLRVVSTLLESIPAQEESGQLSHALAAVASLFRALESPPRKQVAGLWAELFLILQAGDARRLAAAWHADPAEMHDFLEGADRLEVKGAQSGRRHHFRLEQLDESGGSRIVVASMNVRPVGNGPTVGDLLVRLGSRAGVDAQLRAKLERVVADTLGDSWRAGATEGFDEEWAHATLAFYAASDVPQPGPPPLGVSEIRFVSDLDLSTAGPLHGPPDFGSLLDAARSPTRSPR